MRVPWLTWGLFVLPITMAVRFKITSPTHKTAWTRGQRVEITYETADNFDTTYPNVSLDLYRTNGDPDHPKQVTNIAQNVGSEGMIKWTVPKSISPGTDYYLEFVDPENDFHKSSHNFTILAVGIPDINDLSHAVHETNVDLDWKHLENSKPIQANPMSHLGSISGAVSSHEFSIVPGLLGLGWLGLYVLNE
ncbi:hypothetical protein K493DRAFT_303206 [Basidiobolus meristosporus CBS 931.73]|uniref:Yeast cell wall synthesis Kre9/Knh1-like N-terminal domain-containing protein n=1 Tax=Basidiobolus meristosporus CBS 931.73 TaxID=1314790 RepID=A0A1Y1Y3Q2_9FUNG|nr:hypothetical protein K493DRAFT_303206 [Basidiobolus meristosporus CBS 931.73]|eukprot:ORX92618.1 hypothetical protein K493DRAFT_303206 [Basidiobolus meristosporus CBS 931.73]